MFGRRKKEPAPLTVEQMQEQATTAICDAIDVINANMPYLPRSWRPWMDWTVLPPVLCLVERQYNGDLIQHHPE